MTRVRGRRLLLVPMLLGAIASGGGGCATPTTAEPSAKPVSTAATPDANAINGANNLVGIRKPEVVSQGADGKLTVSVTDTDVVFQSSRKTHPYREVTYIITLADGTNYNLQFASSANLDDFKVSVSYKRLYRGAYTVRAYGDKSTESYAEATFNMKDEGL